MTCPQSEHAEGRGGSQSQCAVHGRPPFPHMPRLMVKKKLRLGGYGVTSMFRAMGWLPKLLTSGSKPWYGVASQKRLRALIASCAVCTPLHRLRITERGSSQLTEISRTFTKVAFSM